MLHLKNIVQRDVQKDFFKDFLTVKNKLHTLWRVKNGSNMSSYAILHAPTS